MKILCLFNKHKYEVIELLNANNSFIKGHNQWGFLYPFGGFVHKKCKYCQKEIDEIKKYNVIRIYTKEEQLYLKLNYLIQE